MVDPTMADAGAVVLQPALTFLFDQASDVLSRRRDLRASQKTDGTPASRHAAADLPLLVLPDGVFARELDEPASVLPEVLEGRAGQLLRAKQGVEEYVLGDGPVDVGDPAVRRAVEELRSVLEQVYGTDLTFLNEDRRRTPSVAHSSGQSGGITVGGSLHVGRDFAMGSIHNTSDR